MNIIKKIILKIVGFLPLNIQRHYINPLLIRGDKKEFNPNIFFNSYYNHVFQYDKSDSATISLNYNKISTKYHYNNIEISIIKYLSINNQINERELTILDIGSGTGHWIDFYQSILNVKNIIGCEISSVCADFLKEKYKNDEKVKIEISDILDIKDYENKFDVINAIGVVFHIVDDNKWEKTIINCSKMLKKDGILIVGGNFGLVTQNVQFHKSDSNLFTENESINNNVYLVNKRIRSLYKWKKLIKKAGLQYIEVIKTNSYSRIRTPENNILIAIKKQ